MNFSNSTQITSQVLQGVHYIKFPGTVSEGAVPALVQSLQQWATSEVSLHALELGALQNAVPGFYRAIQDFSNQLKSRGSSLVSLNVQAPIQAEISKLGLETIFNPTRDFRPKMTPQKKKHSEIDVKRLLFKYLVQAAYEAVQITLQSTVSCDENYLTRIEAVPLGDIDLVTIMPVDNDFMKAEFRLCSSKKVLTKFAHAMLGKEMVVDEELVESMALELLNQIYGHAKSNLNDREDFRLPPVIPRLVRKKDLHRIQRSVSPHLTIMPMVTPMGSFYIEVDFGR